MIDMFVLFLVAGAWFYLGEWIVNAGLKWFEYRFGIEA